MIVRYFCKLLDEDMFRVIIVQLKNLTELHNQGKQFTLCKVSAHIGIKGNEEADKAAKQAIDMPGMTTTRLPYTDYYLTIRRARNSEWQKERKKKHK